MSSSSSFEPSTPHTEVILRQFQVTKLRSWRTGYPRRLVLYERDFVTLDPQSKTLKETNRWSYGSIQDAMVVGESSQSQKDAILLDVGSDKLKFQCPEGQAATVLTALLQQQAVSGQAGGSLQRQPIFGNCIRWKRNGMQQQGIILQVQSFGITELLNNQVLQTYLYIDMAGLSFPKGDPTSMGETVVIQFRYPKRLLYTLCGGQRAAFVQSVQTAARAALAEPLPMEPSRTLEEWRRPLSVVATSSSTLFNVTKPPSARRPVAVPRQLCIGPTVMMERDAASIVRQRFLNDIVAIVVLEGGIQMEFTNGQVRRYHLREYRDALVVSLLDAAPWIVVAAVPTAQYRVENNATSNATAANTATSANKNIFGATPVPVQLLQRVQQQATHVWSILCGEFAAGSATTPHDNATAPSQQQHQDEEIQHYVQNLAESPPGHSLLTACREFCYSNAVVKKNDFKLPLLQALSGIAMTVLGIQDHNKARQYKRHEFVAGLLDVLQRLLRVHPKLGAEMTTFRETVGLLFTIQDTFCRFYALQVLQTLLTGTTTTNQDQQRDMETEFVNKNVLFQSGGQALVEGLVALLDTSSSDLILMVATDILQSLLCSHQDTTSPEHFAALLDGLATRETALLSSLRSPTPYVLENTALLLHLLSQHPVSDSIREAALSSGLVLEHFYKGVFSPLEGQRFLSRYLSSQWLTKRLLKRMVPAGFLSYLNMPTISRVEEEQLDGLERDAIEGAANTMDDGAGGGTNTARLRTRMSAVGVPSTENFRILFHVLTQDSNLPDLIWNTQTRRELRIALESEMELLRREEASRIAWNHQQFKVLYPSLENEVKVGNVYMRLWLQAGDGFIRSWEEPVRLFEHLFRRFLCEVDRNVVVTVMCIRCLERLYAIHAEKIGPFTDVMILVQSMSSTRSVETQHRLLGLVASILGVDDIPENAEQLLNAESISQLCQFVAWGHTTGDQIGNMLTRVLGSEGRPMLTDGSDRGPHSADSTVQVAGDLSCPPVWFVASTGRMPPPPELVRGPFRVSDFVRMMEAGEMSQFDLVTTSQVEEYDLDGGGPEAQVDTGKWKRLNQVWQLRWQLCTDGTRSEIYSPSDVALLAVKSLTRLVDLHKSLDPRGLPYFPIPIAKRILTGNAKTTGSEESNTVSNPLPIVCQSLLCDDSRIVEQTSQLIYKLCQHNGRATSKLYLTGVFFFALNYTGSNFKCLAELLYSTHLVQHFRSGFAAAASEDELPMRDRSILGNLLPEGLLYILTNYGFEKFAEIFVGNADTPEVIWTFDMRKHLIEMIRQHLGDFPLRLFQNNTTEYEYCPMPGIAYKRLEDEIFCHNYYLRNLCDEEKFPDWPIAEPVEVFRACLEHFKNEIDRDGTAEEENLERARLELNLDAGDGSKELRKAYRSLARKFHPDKNPAGRETFEKIKTSYELLLPLVERGEKIRVFVESGDEIQMGDKNADYFPAGKLQMTTMHLLITAQLLICRRFEREMSRLKYPAYAILLECIKFTSPAKDCPENELFDHVFAKEERAAFVKSAVELIYRTCLISPENAEGLVSENGTSLLSNLLDFYIRLAKIQRDEDKKCVPSAVIADIISYTVHTICGVAFYDSGREAIKGLQSLNELLMNWQACTDGTLFSVNTTRVFDALIKRHAIEGIANFAQDEVLQDGLVGCGVLWPLLRHLLVFDPTLEQTSGILDDQDDIAASLASTNIVARLSARALGCLSGQFGDCPKNEEVSSALNALLTPPIARMLRNKRSGSVLQFLNSNVERADIIWNVQMRNQLETLLERVDKERQSPLCQSVSEELEPARHFQYDMLANEVRLGGIYVRFFNKGGSDSLAHVEDPSTFFRVVVHFVGKCLNFSMTSRTGWIEVAISQEIVSEEAVITVDNEKFLLALEALRILCRVDGLAETVVVNPEDHTPSVLLSLLELPILAEAFDVAGDILDVLSSREYFANAVTDDNSLWRLLVVLERTEPAESADSSTETSVPKRKSQAWSILEALSSSPSVANKILSSSCWIELLGVLVGYSGFTKVWVARLGAAKTLSRLLWDPHTGVLAESLLKRFLPTTLIVGLKDDSEAMVKSFDQMSDTPELIWDNSMRTELRRVIGNQLDAILRMRAEQDDTHTRYELPPDLYVRYTNLEKELNIGGVYVSRFLKEPTYSLRDPGAFLELLLQRWGKELEAYVHPQAQNPAADSTTLSEAGQDVLDLVTTASVYVCRVRDGLCEKLSSWGYMAHCVTYLEQVLERELFGGPLLAVVRLLHVASSRKTNIESLALVGHSDGRRGVVEFTLKAMECNGLHADTAFMVEFLKKAFHVALGDLKRGSSASFSMAPSPAPGEGPVRRKVNIGDDPLGMFQSAQPLSQPQQTAAPQMSHAMQPPAHTHQSHMQQGPPHTRQGHIQQVPAQPRGYLQGQQQVVPPPSRQQFQANGYQAPFQQHPGNVSSSNFPSRSQPFPNAQQTPQAPSFQQRSQMAQAQPSTFPPPQMYQQNQALQPGQQFHPLTGGYPTGQGQQHAPAQSRDYGQAKAAQHSGYQEKLAEIQRQREAKQQTTFKKLMDDGKQGLSTLRGTVGQAGASLFSGADNRQQTTPQHEAQQPGAASQQYQQQSFPPVAAQSQSGQMHGFPSDPLSNPQQQNGPMIQQQAPQQNQFQNPLQRQFPNPGSQAAPFPSTQPQYQSHQQAGVQEQYNRQGLPQQGQATGFQSQTQNRFSHEQNNRGQASSVPSQNNAGQAFPVQSQHGYQPSASQPPTPGGRQGQSPFQTNGGQPPMFAQQGSIPQGALPNAHNPGVRGPMNSATGDQVQAYQPFDPNSVQDGNPMNQGFGSQPGSTFQVPGQPGYYGASPVVETVDERDPMHLQQHEPTAVEGSGIDARTPEDPKMVAERQAVTISGAPGSAQGRVSLLQQAIACNLCEFLVNQVLEHPGLTKIRDPSGAKVHSIELLKMLCKDPGFGAKFKMTLDELPAWNKYKTQDHSLLITGHEQKADYFLTNGSHAETKLLTES